MEGVKDQNYMNLTQNEQFILLWFEGGTHKYYILHNAIASYIIEIQDILSMLLTSHVVVK